MRKQIILIFILSFLGLTAVNSQQIDYNKFIKDTQKSNSESGEITLVWWIPIEFWKMTFEREESLTKNQIDEFLKILRPYVIFAVVDGKIGPIGGVTYTSVDTIKNTIKLMDKDNLLYKPLEVEEYSADLQNLLSAIKPILKNMMGQLGENMNFFVFTDVKSKDIRVADPHANGSIQLSFTSKKYRWKTPIGSLLPLKKCPVDNEQMDGSWNYCPYHGEKLVEQ